MPEGPVVFVTVTVPPEATEEFLKVMDIDVQGSRKEAGRPHSHARCAVLSCILTPHSHRLRRDTRAVSVKCLSL